MSSNLDDVGKDLVTVRAGQRQRQLRPEETVTFSYVETLSPEFRREVLLRPGHEGKGRREFKKLTFPQPGDLLPKMLHHPRSQAVHPEKAQVVTRP